MSCGLEPATMVWPTTFQLLFHELFPLRKSLEFDPNDPCFMLLTYVATVGSYNDVSQFEPNDTLVQRGSYAHLRKYNSWIFPKCCIGLCILCTLSLVSTSYERSSSSSWGYLELTRLKIFLVDWLAYEAAMQYSVRSSSIATVPYSMKNLITYSQFSSDVLHGITTALQ